MKISKINRNKNYICRNLEINSFSEIEKFPLYINIETTSRCNSHCIMCPRSKGEPDRQTIEMNDSLYEKLLQEMKHHAKQIRRVVPQGFGEPLCDLKLPFRIAKLKEIGICEVFIATNASLLDEEKSQAILESGLDQMDVSIDAFTKETYEKIRRGLNHKIVVNNIKNFVKMRDETKSKTRVRLRYIIQQENVHEFDDFCEFWKEYLSEGDIVYGKKIHTFGANIEMPDSKEYHELSKKLESFPCKSLFSTLFVNCDGSVPTCGVDVNKRYIVGNTNQSSLEEIWQNKLFTDFRKRHLEFGRLAYSYCRECNSWAPELKLSNA